MFRFKKDGQHRVRVQEALPSQLDSIRTHRQHAIFRMLLEFVFPMLGDVDAMFILEVSHVEESAFEQQNHFTNQQLVRRWSHGSPERQFAVLHQVRFVLAHVGLVLIVDARDMAKTGNPGGQQIRPLPQIVPIAEVHLVVVLDDRVRAADFITCPKKFVVGVIQPSPLGLPVRDRGLNFFAEDVFGIDRVERQLHLVDRDRFRRKLDRFGNVVFPVVPSLADHA